MDSYTARMLSTFVFQPSSFLRFAVGMLPAPLLGKGQTLTVSVHMLLATDPSNCHEVISLRIQLHLRTVKSMSVKWSCRR